MDEPERRIVAGADGRVEVHLSRRERGILGALARELARQASGERESPEGPDDLGLARLRPDAIADDPAGSAAFRELTGADLDDQRAARFATLERTLEATSLDDAEAGAWMGAVNDLRLVLGTRLGVTEETGLDPLDEEDATASDTLVFLWLGWVEEQLVEALAAGLPAVPD